MAKKRNEETIRAIRKAARDVILEQGYEAATYSELAKRTGIARTTVQHYVPHKEALATYLMQDIADRAAAKAREIAPEGVHPLALSYLTGQISHGIYYSTPGLRRLLLDVSTDRRLQHAIAPRYEQSEFASVGIEESELDQTALDDVSFVYGGIYEMHFVCLTEGRVPEIHRLVKTNADLMARLLGMGDAERDELLAPFAMPREQLLEIGTQIASEMIEGQ